MRIIGYIFDADCHCISCAQGYFLPATNSGTPDDNGIPVEQRDREGNPIHPLFSTDEFAGSQFCGDCHKRIE